MEFLQPTSLEEALDLVAERADLTPIAGGTDLMVDVNFDRARPTAMLDLTRVPELQVHGRDGDDIRIGAGVPYVEILDAYGPDVPGLAAAARTVGSPQIRNRGTLGGNLGTASPAGDTLPALMAAGAGVVVESAARGTREIPVDEFVLAPRKSALAADELIREVRVPVAPGPQQFSKVGPRNAMVIAVASFAVGLNPATCTVRTGIGSCGPTPLRAREAEAFAAQLLADGPATEGPLSDEQLAEFGRLVAGAARPIDDVRGTREYRVRALEVIGRRCLSWAWSDLGRTA